MSRIGKLPIEIPKGVKLTQQDGMIFVEGPKGKLSQKKRPEVGVEVKEDKVFVTRNDESNASNAYQGLTRQLVHNMVVGVSEGFTKQLVITGVGYRADVKGKNLILALGYSTIIEYVIPEGVEITCDGPNKVNVSGINKQIVGQVSAEIRSLRKPEPYKGKGIKYSTEHIQRKVGQAGGAAK